jgi:diguanylate cyclase (GGDEF)-like protein
LATDIKLLGYVAAALFLFMAVMLLLTLRQAVRVRGATQWVWSTVIVSIGIALNTSQEVIPAFLGLVLANVLIILGAALGAYGTFAYRYERVPSMRALAAGFVLLLLVFAALNQQLALRIVLVAVVTGAINLWHAWLMLAGSKLRPRAQGVKHARFGLPHGIMLSGMLMVAAVLIIRTVDTALNMQSAIPLGGPARTTFLFYAVGLTGRLVLLIGMVLVLIDELGHQLRTLALRDALTGLLNRRGLKDAASERSLADCSLLMMDLDHFKAVNDDFGHDQGDLVIALLARCAQANLPPNAVLARLGGEEFCALLPHVDSTASSAHAELLRTAFHRDSLALGHARQHTVSIGVASAQSAAITLSQLLTRADQALYRAKRNGRNRVEVTGAM